jgi:hypothetical protein
MTDRHDSERDLDRTIARIVEAAGEDAPEPPDSSMFVRVAAAPATPQRRRLATVAALILIVGAGTGTLVLLSRDEGDQVRPMDSSPSSTELGGDTTAVTTPPTSTPDTAPSPSTTSITTTTSDAPSTEVASITRPVTEPSVCVPDSARDSFTEGLTLFARPSSNPVPIQIVADPDDRLVGSFAVVQRYFGDDRTPNGDERVDIGGTTFRISLYENGNGAAEWDVGDGSLGYVRTRGFDRDVLLDVLGALSPRSATDAIPGFEFVAVDGFELLHEQMNTEIQGEVGSFQCDVASTGYRYRISAINGDPVFQYGGVIDRAVPLEVGMRGSTLIVIDGVADPTAPAVDDVVDAEADVWLELRSRPLSPDEADGRTESISEGSDVVVPLDSVDGTTEQGYLTLRLRREEGVTILEVVTADAVLASDAAFWHTDLSPGTGGMSTARVGSVLGFRIGDAPPGESIEVTISVIDGGEFVLQTTGTVTLIPA